MLRALPSCFVTDTDFTSSERLTHFTRPGPFQVDVYLRLGEHLVAAFWIHSHAAKLGAQLADMHLQNKKLGEALQKEAGTVGKAFGTLEGLPRGGHLGLWVSGWGHAPAIWGGSDL